VQERLTQQVATWRDDQLGAQGVGVVFEAEHSGLSLRGVRAAGAVTRTSALTGMLRSNPATRHEFLAALPGGPG
jgi:GTP cyclohydrolase I